MKKTIFILVLLFSIHFFDIAFIPQMINAEDLLSWLIMGASFILVLNKKNLLFRNAIILLFAGIVINIFSAYINQDQKPYDTILSFGFFYYILFYFLLHELELDRRFLENIIIVFAIIYSLVYIAQLLLYPFQLVYVVADVSRGTIRLRIEGNGFLMLAYFLFLNRFLLKHKIKDLIISLLFFAVLFMGGFRTLSFFALLLSVVMFLKVEPYSLKNYSLLAFAAILFIGLFQIKGISNILHGMVVSTQQLINEGNKYIRVVELQFFFRDFPKNLSVYFLGSGLPGGSSSYFRLMSFYEYNLGLFWSDLGVIGFYIIVGPVALAGLLWYAIKAIFIKIPRDRLYLNFYFAYLLVVSITTMEIFREGIFSVQAIALYLIDLAYFENNNKHIGKKDEVTVY